MSSNPITPIRQTPENLAGSPQTHISLQPIAAPSILGLYGFAGATFMVAAHMAHWFGTAQTPQVLWPFAAFFGGLAQFLAGMWSYKAPDGVATAMHGMWGSFWMAFGVLWILVAAGKVTVPANGAAFQGLGFWFIVLGARNGGSGGRVLGDRRCAGLSGSRVDGCSHRRTWWRGMAPSSGGLAVHHLGYYRLVCSNRINDEWRSPAKSNAPWH